MRDDQTLTGFEVLGLKMIFVHDGAYACAMTLGDCVKCITAFDTIGCFPKTGTLHFTYGQVQSLAYLDCVAFESVLFANVCGLDAKARGNAR